MTDRPRLQYVVLRRAGVAQPHYDLEFEPIPGEGELEAWRVATWPPAFKPAPARPLPARPRTSLHDRGPISGHHGRVTRVETGTGSMWMSTGGEWGLRLTPHRRWWQGRRSAISLTFTRRGADRWFVSGQPEPSRLPPVS